MSLRNDRYKSGMLPEKLTWHIYLGHKATTLKVLNRMIDFGGGLFADDPDEREYRRKLWMMRIQLLREWGMFAEALAWICLECDLNPENAAAAALREQMKRQLNLVKPFDTLPRRSRKDIWKGVAGMRDLKAIFEEDIILPLKNPETYALYKIPHPNGFLLYGPPGCGKTYIVEKLAVILRFHYIYIKPSDLGSTFIHGTQLKIKELFEEAEQQSPCLLFIDELEALIPRRDQEIYHSYKTEVNEFLVQLNNAGRKGILVIGATNYIRDIDDAALRPGRMDKKIFVGPPDPEARAEAFRMNLQERPCAKIDYHLLAEETDNFTFSEIEQITIDAAREAAKKGSPITQGMLYKRIINFKPALNEEKIGRYLEDY